MDFLARINAVRYAFLELGVDDGVIVARTDSLGAGLTKRIAYSTEPGDLGDQYNAFLDGEEISRHQPSKTGRCRVNTNSKTIKPVRLPSNLFQFKKGTGVDQRGARLHHFVQNGADLLWIETEKPHIGQIAEMVNKIRRNHSERRAGIRRQPLVRTGRSISANKYLILGKKPGKEVYPLTTVPS